MTYWHCQIEARGLTAVALQGYDGGCMNDKAYATIGKRIAAAAFAQRRREGRLADGAQTIEVSLNELAAVAGVGVREGWEKCWERWQESEGRVPRRRRSRPPAARLR